jgi:hypothetical protein
MPVGCLGSGSGMPHGRIPDSGFNADNGPQVLPASSVQRRVSRVILVTDFSAQPANEHMCKSVTRAISASQTVS